MKGNRRYIQGYNAQAVVNEQQIVIAAEISTAAGDFSHLRPMIEAALDELEQAGESETPTVAVADAQYWNEQHLADVTAQHGIQVLIPPDSGKRRGERPGWTGAGTRSCGACSRVTSASSSTANDNSRSSRSTVTPNTTAGSTGSAIEEDWQYGPSGD
jgi:hypothetical protein